jgi:predicted ribosomally synthesized peptide with SipW-like signal peptide
MGSNVISRRRGWKVAVSLLVLGVLGVALAGTWSAFSATTDNAGNTFSAGTVTLADNDADSAMFSLSNAAAGGSDTGCITVSYTGSLASTVRLYGATGGTGLDEYLDLEITRGSFASAPAFDSCTGFTADATDYIGAGAGVVYSGTLQGYPDDYTTGLVDPTAGTPESWTNPESHVYQIQVTVQDNDLAQGKNATQTFTWEARNS